jgi:glycosyltransferase involved in cell wall biosynthesis
MRIALSVSVIQRGQSGVASYVFGLLDGFREIGAKLDLVLLGLEEDEALFARWRDLLQWIAVPERYRPAVRNVWWHQTALRPLLRQERIDVLHIPSYRRIVVRPPCPQVVTIHDLAAFSLRTKYDRARMIYGTYVVKHLARQVEAITAVSHATAQDIDRYLGIPKEQVRVIWNGIDHRRFRPLAAQEVSAALDRFGQRKPYFIYLARLEHPAKNHLRLIQAFESFCQGFPAQSHELLLGGADWHGADVIHRHIADSPQRDRIKALGFVSDSDLPYWYAGAAAMIYPSLFEGFGLPPLEAMASGCPVISSDRGSLLEVVGNAARIVDPESVEAITAAMVEVVFDRQRASTMVGQGFLRALEFSWAKVAQGMCQVYQQVALRSKSSARETG